MFSGVDVADVICGDFELKKFEHFEMFSKIQHLFDVIELNFRCFVMFRFSFG